VRKRIIPIILLSCKKATQLIEKKLHAKLSRRERIQLTWHNSVCDICPLYEKQVILLDKILKADSPETATEQVFPAEEIKSLQDKIILSIEK
jgi:hypothetical protein